MMSRRRIRTGGLLAVGAILALSCGGCGRSDRGGEADGKAAGNGELTWKIEEPNPPPGAELDLSVLPNLGADPRDKAASTHAYWQNSHAIVEELYKFKNPKKKTPWYVFRPEGMPPVPVTGDPEKTALAYREISRKLESLSARGVDEDALNAWSRASNAYKTMATFIDSSNSGGKAMSNAVRGAAGDVAGPIGDTFNQIESVAKEFRDADAELARVRRLLESRYGTKEFERPRLY